MTGKTFAFELGTNVKILESVAATVRGRAEYAASESSYWVRYVDGNGVPREEWWGESALQAA